jgi:hypothetical protein
VISTSCHSVILSKSRLVVTRLRTGFYLARALCFFVRRPAGRLRLLGFGDVGKVRLGHARGSEIEGDGWWWLHTAHCFHRFREVGFGVCLSWTAFSLSDWGDVFVVVVGLGGWVC